MPLVNFFGGSAIHLDIDVTITPGSVEQARASARKYSRAGFSRFKIKVGATDLDDDARRVRAVAEVASGAQIILDGNTAYKPIEAVALLDALGSARSTVILFEQPVPRDDLEGLAEVEAKSGIIVAADESLRSGDDFQAILKTGGISAINLKTAKLGLLTAWDLLVAARGAGLFIMVGGMVETAISMSASACLAAGVGGVSYADLDTPLFLGAHPVKSSISPWGPRLDFSAIKAGHGADWCGPFPENVAPIEQLLD
jgi:L-alanine-DL-glutamate epimerase-like enolase superfamily enzyme